MIHSRLKNSAFSSWMPDAGISKHASGPSKREDLVETCTHESLPLQERRKPRTMAQNFLFRTNWTIQQKNGTSGRPIKTRQDPSNTHQNPIRTHQNPSKPVKTHQYPSRPRQNPSKPRQNPSRPIKTHRYPSKPVKTHHNLDKEQNYVTRNFSIRRWHFGNCNLRV